MKKPMIRYARKKAGGGEGRGIRNEVEDTPQWGVRKKIGSDPIFL